MTTSTPMTPEERRKEIENKLIAAFGPVLHEIPQTQEEADLSNKIWTDGFLKLNPKVLSAHILSLLNAREREGRMIEIEAMRKLIREHLKYCEEQNGLDYCKNCGLNSDDLPENLPTKKVDFDRVDRLAEEVHRFDKLQEEFEREKYLIRIKRKPDRNCHGKESGTFQEISENG